MTHQPNSFAQTADFEFAALNEAKNYRLALLRDFGPHLRGNVLEVGAGIGQITSELAQMAKIEKLLSIEPHAAFCAQFRARLPRLDLLEGTVGDLKAEANWDAS